MTNSSEVLPSARPRRRWTRFLWVLPVLALLSGLVGVVIVYALASVPLPRQVELPSAAEVFDRDGELIGIFASEERRFTIDTTRLPPHVWRAVIAAEDRDFFEHQGVSPRVVIRAAWANLTGGQISQGRSTITQQYIKNAVLQDPSRTVERKAREAVLALKLERAFSKRQILGFYLNTIYLGRGSYGIPAAASGEGAPGPRAHPVGSPGIYHPRPHGQSVAGEAQARAFTRGRYSEGRLLHGMVAQGCPGAPVRRALVHLRAADPHHARPRHAGSGGGRGLFAVA